MLVSVTLALLITAPEESLTVPKMVPVSTCACRDVRLNDTMPMTIVHWTKATVFRVMIFPRRLLRARARPIRHLSLWFQLQPDNAKWDYRRAVGVDYIFWAVELNSPA